MTFTSIGFPFPVHRKARTLERFRIDPIAFLREMASNGDPLVGFHIGRTQIVLINDPALIEQVLVTDQELYKKGPGLLRARSVLGDGLLTSDGATHRERRRLLQPAFYKPAVAAHLDQMTRSEHDAAREWENGEIRDLHQEMGRLTLGVATSSIFGSDRVPDADSITGAVSGALHAVYGRLSPDPKLGGHGGCPHEAAEYRKSLEASVADILQGFRPSGVPALPSILAEDVGNGMSETDALDEAVTFLIAAHESVANALTWTWALLAMHPEWQERFHAEIDAAGDSALVSLESLERLDVTRRILSESMRLYPPAWMISREAVAPIRLGSHALPTGTVVIAAQCVAHHDARYYSDPDLFDPDRWLPEAAETRPRFAYFPFGGGPRLCIGERFAWTELISTIAVLGRSWKFRLVDGIMPLPDPVVTLRPRGGALMIFERRT